MRRRSRRVQWRQQPRRPWTKYNDGDDVLLSLVSKSLKFILYIYVIALCYYCDIVVVSFSFLFLKKEIQLFWKYEDSESVADVFGIKSGRGRSCLRSLKKRM